MVKFLWIALFTLGATFPTSSPTPLGPPSTSGALAPADAFVRGVLQGFANEVEYDRDIQSGDQDKLVEVIERSIAPHIDFVRLTRLSLGRNWNLATPAEQAKLVSETHLLLVHIYSSMMMGYRFASMDFLPFRAPATATDVTVYTRVLPQGKQPVSLNFDVEKVPNGWKLYDIEVDGLSIAGTFRDQFKAEVAQSGIPGLIDVLVHKNEKLKQDIGRTKRHEAKKEPNTRAQ